MYNFVCFHQKVFNIISLDRGGNGFDVACENNNKSAGGELMYAHSAILYVIKHTRTHTPSNYFHHVSIYKNF